MPLAKVSDHLQTKFGLSVTPGRPGPPAAPHGRRRGAGLRGI